MGQSSPAPSMDRPLKSRWLNRHATAFQVMDFPPTPRLRSDENPSTPGRMVGMCRLGKSNGMACVLNAVRVLILGPPSTTTTSTPWWARCAESVPPEAPEPTTQTSYTFLGMWPLFAYYATRFELRIGCQTAP